MRWPVLPHYLNREDVPLPLGWTAYQIQDIHVQLPIGVRRDSKTCNSTGTVPVVDQSEDGVLGWHDDEPGIAASPARPVVTFANHTCEMRMLRHPFSVIQNVFPKVGKEPICSTEFLYYATKGRVRLTEYKGHHPEFRSAWIPVPSKRLQERIVDLLSAYDDLIENNTKRIKILEEMARSLYREWFVEFRFPGYEEVRLVDSGGLNLPATWRSAALSEIALDLRDSVDPSHVAPDMPYFGLEHLPRRSTTLNMWGEAREVQSTKLLVRAGDILFGKIRPYFHKVGVAPVDAVCSSDTIVLRPCASEMFGIVLGCVSSDDFVAHATRTSQGTKMPRANWDVLREYRVAVPSEDSLRSYNRCVLPAIELASTLALKNRSLSRTRDLLLPRLLSGEIDVSSLPDPA